LNRVEKEIGWLLGREYELGNTLMTHQQRVAIIESEVNFLTEARSLYQKVSTLLRVKISERFADLATRALRYIFQRDDMKFLVELDVKSNLPVASFFVIVGGHKYDPKEALGGSVYEVVGICLRLVCLEVFNLTGPLILDEPLRSVDEINLQHALEFILQYCRSTGRQLIIVTHNELIAQSADKLFEVVQEGGVSFVHEAEL
jgi:DNA repair exonuclease SbcCD ATPase subunit